jgi:hypothetical protein
MITLPQGDLAKMPSGGGIRCGDAVTLTCPAGPGTVTANPGLPATGASNVTRPRRHDAVPIPACPVYLGWQ